MPLLSTSLGYEVLLAVGITFCMASFVLRGIHQQNKRSAALRAQNARFTKPTDDAQQIRPPTQLERKLPLIYRCCFAVGAALVVLAVMSH